MDLPHPDVTIIVPSRWTNINPSLLTKANSVRDEFTATDTYYNLSSIFDDSWTHENLIVNFTKAQQLDLANFSTPCSIS